MHTGDLAREDDEGFWYIVDRTKDMIVTGGFNVFPREVEDVVAEHPSVAQVCVIGTPDEKWGEAVTACRVPKRARAHRGQDHCHARESIAGYKVASRSRSATSRSALGCAC
jgi:acyl-CoA synthetase (AMP-forming)/AMP-acid ligase II